MENYDTVILRVARHGEHSSDRNSQSQISSKTQQECSLSPRTTIATKIPQRRRYYGRQKSAEFSSRSSPMKFLQDDNEACRISESANCQRILSSATTSALRLSSFSFSPSSSSFSLSKGRKSPTTTTVIGYSRHRSSGLMTAALLLLIVLVQRLSVPADAQRISTQPQTFKVRVGESVQLPCNFAELDDEDKVVVWKRGLDVLAIDEELTISDTRFQVKKEGLNYVLEISAIESYDSSDYTCSVTSNPPIEITHKLQVNVPPGVKLIPSTSPLLARVGEEVIVKCVGSGNPPPAVKWRRQSAPAGALGDDARLRIAHAATADAGVYECRASNDVGDDATVTVEIRVESLGGTSTESSTENADENAAQSAPWVETDATYIPVRLGAPANLSCRYDGAPEPTADWLFSGFKINNFDSKFKGSAKFASRVKNHSVTTFAIGEVHEDHFGDYTCKIANGLGTAERIIHLSGRPGPPVITVLSDNALYWTVQSAQPIFEYKVYHRFASDDTWVDHKLVKSSKDDQQGEFWTHKVVLDFLKPDADYELQVNARNELGWGSLARSFVKYRSSSASGKITSDALEKNVNGASKMVVQDIRSLVTRLALSTILLVLPVALILL